MEVRVKGVQEGARTLYAIGRQLIYTAIGIATGYAALSLHSRGEDGTPDTSSSASPASARSC